MVDNNSAEFTAESLLSSWLFLLGFSFIFLFAPFFHYTFPINSLSLHFCSSWSALFLRFSFLLFLLTCIFTDIWTYKFESRDETNMNKRPTDHFPSNLLLTVWSLQTWWVHCIFVTGMLINCFHFLLLPYCIYSYLQSKENLLRY